MKSHAPHLPPTSCSIDTHKHMKSIKWVFLISILSVFAGATAALVTIAWFMPLADTGIVYFGERPSVIPQTPYNPAVERETKERLLLVYDERYLQNGIAYSEDAKLGTAVVLSSDGWAVLQGKGELPLKQFVRGADSSGGVHKAQKLVFDADAGLLYIKFEGTDFRIQSFVDWSQINPGKNVFVANGLWRNSRIRAYEKPESSIDIWKHTDRYSLEDAVAAGSVVYDESGRFIGFVDKDGFVELCSSVQNSFAGVVEKQQVELPTHSWIGEFIDGYIDSKSETLVGKSGFLVSKVEAGELSLKTGDIIVQINGSAVDPASFARILRDLSEPYTLGVIRNKELLEITIVAAKKP